MITVARLHARQHRSGAAQEAAENGVDHPVSLVEPPGSKWRKRRCAGIVHQHVERCARDLDVATLADEASMSALVFHSHFRAVTHPSPVQHIKAVRLHQAHLLKIRNGYTAASAAAHVGHESAS